MLIFNQEKSQKWIHQQFQSYSKSCFAIWRFLNPHVHKITIRSTVVPFILRTEDFKVSFKERTSSWSNLLNTLHVSNSSECTRSNMLWTFEFSSLKEGINYNFKQWCLSPHCYLIHIKHTLKRTVLPFILRTDTWSMFKCKQVLFNKSTPNNLYGLQRYL